MEGGAGGGATGGVYMRKTDGSSAAVRLGDGWNARQDLSPDKKWVVQALADRLNLLPVGPGESKTLQDKDLEYIRAAWFPDGKRLLLAARTPGHGPRMYVRDLASGPPRPFTPEGVAAGRVSPDGRLVAAADMKTKQVGSLSGGWSRRRAAPPARHPSRRVGGRLRREGREPLPGLRRSDVSRRSPRARDRQAKPVSRRHAGRPDRRGARSPRSSSRRTARATVTASCGPSRGCT